MLKQITGLLPKRYLARAVSLAGVIIYLMGYQPTLAIPPYQKSIVLAEYSQDQNITADNLSQPFQLPHIGYISNHYAFWHQAIDIAAGLGTPVHPIASGKVVRVAWDLFGLGHYAVIEHGEGYKSTYGHMGRVFTQKGAQVTTSSTLGEVGLTGRTTGPHTHLEIQKNGRFIDPEKILPLIPVQKLVSNQ